MNQNYRLFDMTVKRITAVIGERFPTLRGNVAEVIAYPADAHKRVVKFVDGGDTAECTVTHLKSGRLISKFDKTLCGVGYIGAYSGKATDHPLYMRWANIMRRCYDPKSANYKSYGAKGVTVSEEFHSFANFSSYVSSLPNYKELAMTPQEWQIDKDVNGGGEYSRFTIQIIKSSENLSYENAKKRIAVYAIDDTGKAICRYESINEAEKATGVHRGNIARALKHGYVAGGVKWGYA